MKIGDWSRFSFAEFTLICLTFRDRSFELISHNLHNQFRLVWIFSADSLTRDTRRDGNDRKMFVKYLHLLVFSDYFFSRFNKFPWPALTTDALKVWLGCSTHDTRKVILAFFNFHRTFFASKLAFKFIFGDNFFPLRLTNFALIFILLSYFPWITNEFYSDASFKCEFYFSTFFLFCGWHNTTARDVNEKTSTTADRNFLTEMWIICLARDITETIIPVLLPTRLSPPYWKSTLEGEANEKHKQDFQPTNVSCRLSTDVRRLSQIHDRGKRTD